jgi:predicted phosphodiesterase
MRRAGRPEHTREELQAVVEAVQRHGTYRKAATALGLTYGMVQRRFEAAVQKRMTEDKAILERAPIEQSVEEKLRYRLRLAEQQIARIHRENDSAETIRRLIFGISEQPIEPPAWMLKEGSPGSRGGPVTIWSDWHWGEIVRKDQVGGVNEFNETIARRRIKTLVETTINLCFHHMGRGTPRYPGIVICLGGDMMTGDIHDELKENAWATPQQSIKDITDLLAGAIDAMATKFGRVFLPCVVGNHGRGTLRPRAKGRIYTSHEWVIYTNLERHFSKSKAVRFYISPETDAHFKVYGHRFLLTHGDALGVKGGDGIIGALGPIMRGAIKVGRSEAQIGRDFDTLLIGHWHQRMTPPGVVVNGALVGYDEYARICLRARYERPSQQLLFVHPEHGITATWPIYLEPRRNAREGKDWVTWQ